MPGRGGGLGSGYMAYLVGEPAFARACAEIGWASRLDEQETKLLVGLVGWILMSRLRLEQRQRRLRPAGLAQLLRGSCSRHREGVGGRTERRAARPALEVPVTRAEPGLRGRVNAVRAGVPRAGWQQRPRNLARARAFERPTAQQRERRATGRLQNIDKEMPIAAGLGVSEHRKGHRHILVTDAKRMLHIDHGSYNPAVRSDHQVRYGP